MHNELVHISANNVASSAFVTYSYETDCFSEARLAFFFRIVQEAAGNHAYRKGCSISALQKEGMTWVITRTQIEVSHYTKWPEQIEVETWAQAPIRLHFPRVIRACDATGKPVFRAKTYWAVLNLETGRPIRPEGMVERIGTPPLADLEHHENLELQRRLTYEESKSITLVSYKPSIAYLDTDRNHHVNNISYINWALDSLPSSFRDRCKVKTIDVSWIRQTFSGDDLTVYTGSADPKALFSDEPTLYHKIARKEKDGAITIVWEGMTEWKIREELR